MRRLLLLALVAALPACGSPRPATLTVLLPTFEEYLDNDPPRRNRLTVAGVEQVLSPDLSGLSRTVTVPPGAVEVELAFWPVRYSNTFRKKTVTAQPGESLTVNLREPDPDRPDRFEAIFFPAPPELTEVQMQLGGVGKGDTVLDIGCGDGRLAILAVKDYGAKKGVGIDIRQELVDLSHENAKKQGVADRCEFRNEDALKMTDLSPYSVVYLYLGEELSARLRPVLQKTLKKGARVVSNTFPIGDWEPDVVEKVICTNNFGEQEEFTLYLWTVR